MGLILGVFIALGIITISAVISFAKMWGSPSSEEGSLPLAAKIAASVSFLEVVLGIIVMIIYACR